MSTLTQCHRQQRHTRSKPPNTVLLLSGTIAAPPARLRMPAAENNVERAGIRARTMTHPSL